MKKKLGLRKDAEYFMYFPTYLKFSLLLQLHGNISWKSDLWLKKTNLVESWNSYALEGMADPWHQNLKNQTDPIWDPFQRDEILKTVKNSTKKKNMSLF